MSGSTHVVILSRDLPLPSVKAGDKSVIFQYVAGDNSYPQDAKVYCSTALDTVDAELIARLPKSVGLIANLGVGTDNIDLEAAKKRNIIVSNTPVVTEDTADLTFALILAACRKVGINERFLRAGKWSETVPHGGMGVRVHGKTLGIVGFGAIGQAVARRATGFGMNILYWNRSRKLDAETQLKATYVTDLDDMLSQSDIVSLHTPLSGDTHKLINHERLQKIKTGAVLINTGRGPLIDEAAMIESLATGQLAAAGLDVFETEPDVSEQLRSIENVVLTPHIGSATAECRLNIVQRGIGNIISFLEKGTPIDLV